MVDRARLRRYAALNACAGVAAAGVLIYVVRKWMQLPQIQHDGAAGYTLLVVGVAFALVSSLYVFFALVMMFAYKPNVPMEAAVRLKVLRFGGNSEDLALVWHDGSLCITEYREAIK